MNHRSEFGTYAHEVRFVFGENLEALMRGRYSKRKLSETIGISRSQLDRYLSGKSTPRADILQRFCKLFDVDANILIRPLAEAKSDSEFAARPSTQSSIPRADFVASLIDRLENANLEFRQQFRLSDEELPLGVYRMWVTSIAKPGLVASSLLIVQEKRGLRTWRFAPLGWISPGEPAGSHARRSRVCGIFLKQHLNHLSLFINQANSSVHVWHSIGNFNFGDGQRIINGHYYWMADNPVLSTPNVQKFMMEKASGGFRELRAIAREPRYFPVEKLPYYVRHYLGLDTDEGSIGAAKPIVGCLNP